MKFIRNFVKGYAPKSYKDGLLKCDNLGMSLFQKRNIERFLDIGCGDGELTIQFANKLKPKEIYGVELVDQFRNKAQGKGVKCCEFDLNGKWSYKDNFFDCMLSSQNIEHLHNTRLYLEEAYRCLKPGGELVILTENLASWPNIVSLFFGWQPFSTTNINGWKIGNPLIYHIDDPVDEVFVNKWQGSGVSGTVGHVRVLTFMGLMELLVLVGFKNVKLYTRGYIPFYGKISDILCYLDKRHGHFLIASAHK